MLVYRAAVVQLLKQLPTMPGSSSHVELRVDLDLLTHEQLNWEILKLTQDHLMILLEKTFASVLLLCLELDYSDTVISDLT